MYVKLEIEDTFVTNNIASKSRVAPLKKLSLPRLELMYALIAARLKSEAKKIIDKNNNLQVFPGLIHKLPYIEIKVQVKGGNHS